MEGSRMGGVTDGMSTNASTASFVINAKAINDLVKPELRLAAGIYVLAGP